MSVSIDQLQMHETEPLALDCWFRPVAAKRGTAFGGTILNRLQVIVLSFVFFLSGRSPVAIARGQGADLTIKSKPTLCLKGVALDESKRPVPDVSIEVTIRASGVYGYAGFGNTDVSGRFELSNLPLNPFDFIGTTNARAQVLFEHPDLLPTMMRNAYILTEAQRTNLQITLLRGHEIRGTVTSATGEPVPDLPIDAVLGQTTLHKGTKTDSEGRFTLRGLQGEVVLTAHSLPLKQKAQRRLTLSGGNLQIDLRLELIVYKQPIKTYKIFGMTLANLTTEIQHTYDLPSPQGVVILDPGKDSFRLGIGTLAEGQSFWIIGSRTVGNFREMVQELVRINSITPPGPPNVGCRGHIRLVYNYPRWKGTNTQFLSLNDQDVQELMAILEKTVQEEDRL